MTHNADSRTVIEWCRECRDEGEWMAPGVPAEFILWGKLLPPEALGPRCYDHTAKWLGWQAMGRLDQYAAFDLRPYMASHNGSSGTDGR